MIDKFGSMLVKILTCILKMSQAQEILIPELKIYNSEYLQCESGHLAPIYLPHHIGFHSSLSFNLAPQQLQLCLKICDLFKGVPGGIAFLL